MFNSMEFNKYFIIFITTTLVAVTALDLGKNDFITIKLNDENASQTNIE